MQLNKKNGYTEIASESMGSTEEATPLVSRVVELRSPGVESDSKWQRWKFIVAGVSACIVLIVVGVRRVRPRGAEQTIEVLPEEMYPSILYRPVCEYYKTVASRGTLTPPRKAPYLIQTSMQEPSQQWSVKPCFAANPQTRRQRMRDSETVELNSYGAADAILQVNFSQAAFVGREHPILGFGGAFTEAAALNYQRLTQQGKDAVMELLFGRSGLGYSIGRVHINSCDFSVKSYSFDETEDDFDLVDFDVNVKHDAESGMIDMALRATSVFREAWGTGTGNASRDGELKIYASPWSPPAWMKKPTWEDKEGATHAKKMTYSAEPTCLKEGVGKSSRYAKAWALYFSYFLTAYRNLGLPMWAITVQNEPEFAAPWEACAYTPSTQKDFIANHLGPRLEKDHPDVKLFIFDHNKDHVNTWVQTLLDDRSEAAKYVDGTAYHWYAGGMDRLLDGAIGSPNMHRLQAKLEALGVKKKHIVLGSEACHCPTTGYAGGDPDIYWARAERYAHTILADLAAGSNSWVEWNLVLDGIGGPNHLGNLCEATILSVPHRATAAGKDIKSLPSFEKDRPMGNVSIGDGRTREELNSLGFPAKFLDVGLAVQPMYFYMGHISRYIRPGSEAVLGLVNSAPDGKRIFRPDGQSVAGGGFNELARNGIELTLWPCEGSTRQQFTWDEKSTKIEVSGHDWLGNPTKSCVSRRVDKDLMGLRLSKCGRDAGLFDFVPLSKHKHDFFQVVLRNAPKGSGSCLVVSELKNGGGAYGPRGGAQVSLGDCDAESAKWKIDRSTGEAMSFYFADTSDDSPVCLTTGWPFLQMGAFVTPNGEAPKTIVVLNEARDSANYAVQDENEVVLTGTIPPRSIQTLLIE